SNDEEAHAALGELIELGQRDVARIVRAARVDDLDVNRVGLEGNRDVDVAGRHPGIAVDRDVVESFAERRHRAGLELVVVRPVVARLELVASDALAGVRDDTYRDVPVRERAWDAQSDHTA